LGLIVAQGVYVVQFWRELVHLLELFANGSVSETEIMLIVLSLIDVVMIANLLIMVIVGGYETFVSRLYLEGHPDQPEWLSHVNASVLKVKLATAIIGISSIHLLKTFINAPQLEVKTMMWQTIIHITFLVSAIAIAATDRLLAPKGGH
ncbi:MAG: TIGR00645 family protein, partial [Burkholderiales bacterium]|nr:TIGR00645 family protein [Burkholderiales bacterium]